MATDLNAIDNRRIESKESAVSIAHTFLDNVDAAPEVYDMANQLILGTGNNGWHNESPIAQFLDVSPSNSWSEIAAAINHDVSSDTFESMSVALLPMIDERSLDSTIAVMQEMAAVAATLGFKLIRHVAEKTLADKIGGRVAPSEEEGDSVDIYTADGHTVQVYTGTSPQTANGKMSDNAQEKIDYYVALMIRDGEYGVGVNDMRQSTSYKGDNSSAATSAKDA